MLKNKRFLSMLLVLTMVVTLFAGFGGSASAITTDVDAYAEIIIYDTDGTPYVVDYADINVPDGDTVYDVVNDYFDYYYPDWTLGIDPYNGQTTYYLESFVGYEATPVDYQYNPDGSGWSIDWGWVYEIDGVMPYFTLNPYHLKAMNQYEIQDGDDIDIIYAYVYTEWNSNGDIIDIEILDPSTSNF